MKSLAWLPDWLRAPMASMRNKYRVAIRRRTVVQLARKTPKKIVVGAGGTQFRGWISTEQDILNLVMESDWATYFAKDSVDTVLAEHVWEHLTPGESRIAATQCFKFLKPGGYLRVAVPDGNHPNASYIDAVRPGGNGPGADDHKALYTYESLRSVFIDVGFDVVLLEYFDERGEFHYSEWDRTDGFIERSKRFDHRNADGTLTYTSIILDARKPL
jgi:predicted SAM-dependent methyltransferase